MLAPRGSLDKLKCVSCRKYLSVLPVYLSENDGQTCGRCASSPPANSIKDVTYEQIAKFLRFPCIFNVEGCLDFLLPSEVPNHEKSCSFRVETCPANITTGCDWKGPCNNVILHCEEQHPTFFLNQKQFELDIVNSNHIENLIQCDSEIFVFKRIFDAKNKTLSFCVVQFSFKNISKKFDYEITLENGPKTLRLLIPEDGRSVVLDRDVFTRISMDTLMEKLQDPAIITGRIDMSLQLDEADQVDKKTPVFDVEMLSDLECPICFDHMIENIFLCQTGHSICSNCKTNLTECPTCKSILKDCRNFGLERMASRTVFPCKYREYGCNFTAKPELMKNHQKYCKNGPQACPLEDYTQCEWKDSFGKMLEHVDNYHHENFLEIDTIAKYVDDDYLVEVDSDCQILTAYGEVFKLHYLYEDERFYWSVQFMGPPENSQQFMFEIDVVDNAGHGQRTYFRMLVSPLTEKGDFNKPPNCYVYASLNNIKYSIHHNTFTYRVRILK